MIAWVLAAALGVAAHAGEGGQATAALLQVDHLLELGEVGRAVALTRRGSRLLEDDVDWHLARLRALRFAGMEAWIRAEYAERGGKGEAARIAWAAFRVRAGEAAPDAPDHPAVAAARAWRALETGGVDVALALARGVPGVEGATLRLEARARAGDVAGLEGEARAWLAGGEALRPLAALWSLEHRKLTRVRADALAAVDRALTGGPAEVLDAAVVALAAGDAARAGALADRARALGDDPRDLQAVVDALDAGPEGWDVWETARRPRWSRDALQAEARALAATRAERPGWTRRDEGEALAVAWARALDQAGEPGLAARVLDRWGGPCAPGRGAELLARAGRGREARETAERALFGCVGRLDVDPATDPAGLDVTATLDEVAGAWERFALAARAAGWEEEARVGASVAARLAPTPERVALAKDTAGAVLPVPEVVAALEDAGWLVPPGAVASSRARRVRARTAALLTADPRWLAEAASPMAGCLATTRARCMLEHAVARHAAERAGVPVPEGVEPVRDRGAVEAAPGWLAACEAAWFSARAELARLDGGASRRLQDVLDAPGAAREGVAAPPWSAGAWRGEALRGRVVVLAFWASWSRPSLTAWPVLDALVGRWAREGLPVQALGVGVDEDADRYARQLARLPQDALPAVRAPEVRERLGVDEVPAVIVIDADGVIRVARSGDLGDGAWLDDAVRTWAGMASR